MKQRCIDLQDIALPVPSINVIRSEKHCSDESVE
jgi:hypothetical protein